MKKKILIVEDEEMLSKVLTDQFSKADFDVEAAFDGEKALKFLEKFKPDIILLDIILPKINGFDVLRTIKENPNTQDIPVIMISNLGRDEDIKQAIKLGAVDYYIKAQHPIFEIIEKVSNFLSLPKSPLERPKVPVKEKKVTAPAPLEVVEEKPAEVEKILEKPIEKVAEKLKVIGKIIEEKPIEKVIEKPKKEAAKKPSKEIGSILGKIIDIAEESAKQVIEKKAQKAAEKLKIIEKPKLKKIEEKPVIAIKPIKKEIIGKKMDKKEKREFPQLSRGARKFVRMEKSKLNRMKLTPEEREKEIAKIYQTFSR